MATTVIVFVLLCLQLTAEVARERLHGSHFLWRTAYAYPTTGYIPLHTQSITHPITHSRRRTDALDGRVCHLPHVFLLAQKALHAALQSRHTRESFYPSDSNVELLVAASAAGSTPHLEDAVTLSAAHYFFDFEMAR